MKKTKRINKSLLSPVERKIIYIIVRWLPAWVTPNILTSVGFIAAILVGLSYVLAGKEPFALFGAGLFIFLNWFGDSLDGNLARYRRNQKLKFGFYIDHITDALSVLSIFLGLTISPLTNTSVWLVVAYFYVLFELNTMANTIIFNEFSLSFSGFGPTEARLVLLIVTIVSYFLYTTTFKIFSWQLTFFDLVGVFIVTILTLAFFKVMYNSCIRTLQTEN